MKKVFFLALVTLALVACVGASEQAVPTVTPKPSPTTFQAVLECQECEDAGMEINLWATADRAGLKTTGSVSHNTPVTVVDSTSVDGIRYYQVRAVGMTGWVSEDFVKR